MDNKSTPISHLRRNEDEGDADVDNMVHDIEGGGGDPRGDPRAQRMPGYDGDDEPEFEARDPHSRPPPGYGMHPGMMPPGYGMHPPPGYHQGPANTNGAKGLENVGMGQKILSEAKEPLLVAVLVVILSSGQVGSLISRFLPMANSNPLIGLIVRALLAGAAFYLLRRFIPT